MASWAVETMQSTYDVTLSMFSESGISHTEILGLPLEIRKEICEEFDVDVWPSSKARSFFATLVARTAVELEEQEQGAGAALVAKCRDMLARYSLVTYAVVHQTLGTSIPLWFANEVHTMAARQYPTYQIGKAVLRTHTNSAGTELSQILVWIGNRGYLAKDRTSYRPKDGEYVSFGMKGSKMITAKNAVIQFFIVDFVKIPVDI